MPAMLGKRFVDQLLRVGIGGAAQRQRDGTERQLEQPVAAPRLKVIMPLGRRSRDKFDLAFIEPEALIGRARDRKSTTSELQSLMRISYAVFCLKKKKYQNITT